MSDLPEPLTPADCELRDFPYMPLDVGRLRDSKLASHVKPQHCWFAVLLWCASWHQVPAASLPDDDIELAKLAGFGFVVKEWKKIREGALYGWIKCSDGRLYHPIVAEKANDAWSAKHVQRHKTECARIKKHNQRYDTDIPFPTLEEFLSPDYSDPVPRDKKEMSPGTNGGSPSGNTIQGKGREGNREVNLKTGGNRTDGSTPPATVRPSDLSAAMRRHSIEAQPGDPRIIAAAAAGMTVETVEAACAEAKSRKPGERISAGYVIAMAEAWTREARQQRPAANARASPRPPSIHEQRDATIAGLTGRNRHDAEDRDTIDIDAHRVE